MSQTIFTRNISTTTKLGHRLIKFRYGPQRRQEADSGVQQPANAKYTTSKASSQGSQEVIWDFQIPARWRRAPISDEECAVINSGGAL